MEDEQKEVTFYNASHVELEEVLSLINGDRLHFDLKDHCLVYKDGLGWTILSEQNVIAYAFGLVDSNPELWDELPHDLDSAINIIEHTLPNERVVKINSKV